MLYLYCSQFWNSHMIIWVARSISCVVKWLNQFLFAVHTCFFSWGIKSDVKAWSFIRLETSEINPVDRTEKSIPKQHSLHSVNSQLLDQPLLLPVFKQYWLTLVYHCWWKKSWVISPIMYKVLYIRGGAGFLPSTVSMISSLFWTI